LGQREGRAHRKNTLYSEVWSAGGEWRRGRRPGVVVDSSRCREVLRGGAVLGAWSNLSEGGQSGLPVVAGMAEEEERVLHGRGGRPLQPLEAVDDGGVAVGKRWTGKWWRRGRVCGQGGGHCLKEVGAVWAPSVRETDTRGPRGFDFSNLFKTGSIWK
jgi:hypothetical protein